MSTIKLSSSATCNVVVISNIFIDKYMPQANGDYVKVYLYLLRYLNDKTKDFSISFLADRLDITEKDILRSFNYWEKVGLISLDRSSNDEIIGISLNEPTSAEDNLISASKQTLVATIAPLEQESYEVPEEKPDRLIYTNDQIAELTDNDEIKWIMNIIEIYLERLLKPRDVQLILYLYDTVGFSSELIMYLYEYCVSKNKKNASYIEAVALSWAEEGIDTVEKAEATTILYNSNYNSILKALGLNRAPGAIEKQYMDKWISKYQFDIRIIVEACNRTLLNTGKPDFKYADKILENWLAKGVKIPADITALDETHHSSRKMQPAKAPNTSFVGKTYNNQFNSFPQRKYTAEDYSSLEKRLLNK